MSDDQEQETPAWPQTIVDRAATMVIQRGQMLRKQSDQQQAAPKREPIETETEHGALVPIEVDE